MSPIRACLALLGLSVILLACGDEGGAADTTSSTSATGDNATSSTSIGGEDMDLVDQAVVDLATRLSVSETDIALISMEEVTWSDSSLGCPKPGELYTQALVDGHRIVLGHVEKVYVYHSGETGDPFLCPNPDSKDGGYDFVPTPGDDTR